MLVKNYSYKLFPRFSEIFHNSENMRLFCSLPSFLPIGSRPGLCMTSAGEVIFAQRETLRDLREDEKFV